VDHWTTGDPCRRVLAKLMNWQSTLLLQALAHLGV
jgi:hypothetical protein